MSADRLREAARVLRERAEAATPGPWGFDDTSGPGPNKGEFRQVNADGSMRVGGGFLLAGPWVNDADPAYIATMHPVVGLALADWLDVQADTTCDCGVDESALAVADLILGGAP